MSLNVQADVYDRFKGFVRIGLSNIEFCTARDLNEDNVKRLEGIFELVGCQRDDPANAIPVILGSDCVADVACHERVESSYTSPSRLPFVTTKVICLHGKHRIHAARRFLPAPDQWWVAKVFDTGMKVNVIDVRID